MLLKVHSGEFFNNKTVPTVKEMIDISLKINRASRKVLTHKAYVGNLNKHVLPVFGKRKIDSIKPSEFISLAKWFIKYTFSKICNKSEGNL